MKFKEIYKIITEEEARQIAIDFQTSFNEKSYSYSELNEIGGYFQKLAEKFNLIEEFKENGII